MKDRAKAGGGRRAGPAVRRGDGCRRPGPYQFRLIQWRLRLDGRRGQRDSGDFPPDSGGARGGGRADVQDGTQLGVGAALLQKPELRPYFEASREALNALLAAQTTDPVQLQADLNQSVPAVEQPLVDAALEAAIGTYATWYNANAAQLTASDTTKYALQILTALDTGLNAALGSNTVSAQPVAL